MRCTTTEKPISLPWRDERVCCFAAQGKRHNPFRPGARKKNVCFDLNRFPDRFLTGVAHRLKYSIRFALHRWHMRQEMVKLIRPDERTAYLNEMSKRCSFTGKTRRQRHSFSYHVSRVFPPQVLTISSRLSRRKRTSNHDGTCALVSFARSKTAKTTMTTLLTQQMTR